MAYQLIDAGNYEDWTPAEEAESFVIESDRYDDATEKALIVFNAEGQGQETYAARIFDSPVEFVYGDYYSKDQRYNRLVVNIGAALGMDMYRDFRGVFKGPDDFTFTLSLWSAGVLLREWFLPIVPNGCACSAPYILDLTPLIESGYREFDELRIGILDNPGDGFILALHDTWLMHDEVEHNVCSAIQELLHGKIRSPMGQLVVEAKAGGKEILLSSAADVYALSAIEIDGDLYVFNKIAMDRGGKCRLTLSNHYSGDKLLRDYPAGTQVYSLIPATITALGEDETIFSVFHITHSPPETEETWTPMGIRKTDYVRDPVGNHTVTVGEARDTVRLSISIGVFAPIPEIAIEMLALLRKIFNNQNKISVCGLCYDYEIAGTEELEESSAETGLPTSVLNLIVYGTEDLHDKSVQSFPPVKELTVIEQSASSLRGGLPTFD